jgi:hypothetical protein
MPTLRLIPPLGEPIEVTRDLSVVGRDPLCDLVLPDGSVSRRHARLERRGDTWFVVDTGSANGTTVDSQRVTEAVLRAGQQLRFGAASFRVEIEGAEETMFSGPTDATVQSPTVPEPRAVTPPPLPPLPVPAVPPPPAPGLMETAEMAAVRNPPPPPPVPGGRRPIGHAAGGPPPLPGPSKKGRGTVFWIAAGGCGCLLAILAAVGLLVGGVFFMTSGAVEAARGHLAAIRDSRLAEAYAGLAEAYRAQVSQGAFEAYVAAHPALREHTGVSIRQRNVQNQGAQVGGVLHTATGDVPFEVRLEKDAGGWKVTGLSTDGAELVREAEDPGTLEINAGEAVKVPGGRTIEVVLPLTVTGFDVRPAGQGFLMDLVEDVETLGPDGLRVEPLTRTEFQRVQRPTALARGAVAVMDTKLTLGEDSAPGRYTVRITVRDLVGGAQGTYEVQFDIP